MARHYFWFYNARAGNRSTRDDVSGSPFKLAICGTHSTIEEDGKLGLVSLEYYVSKASAAILDMMPTHRRGPLAT